MQKYPKSLLIIEGDLNETLEEDTNIARALRGLIVSISTNYPTSIILSKNNEIRCFRFKNPGSP